MATDAGTVYITARLDASQAQAGFKELQKSAVQAAAAVNGNMSKGLGAACKSVGKSAGQLKDLVGKHFDKISNKIDSVVGNIARKGAAAIGGAISSIVTGAVKCFSDYEQLAGGVDKLFGGAAAAVKKNAQNAFQTAGMSANQYMETVTNFSASLIAGLGGDTKKASKIADVAIRDMADNANTFGTSMSEIQYAYKGFAKQNYTMLDNLKLGYGGTASEMARLVNDSGVMGSKFKATAKNINSVSFDKIIEAVHVIQERMKVAGTTSREAAGTLEGSFNSMKSAAQNFLTALGTGQDVDGAFQQMVKSAEIWLGNLIPVVKRVVDSILRMLDEKCPQFMKPARAVVDFVLKNKGAIINALVAIGGALAFIRIGKFASDLASAIGTFKEIGKAAFDFVGSLKDLAVAAATNPMILIVGGVIALIAGLVLLYAKCEGFRNFVNGVASAVGGLISGTVSTIVAVVKGIIGFIVPPIQAIVGFIGGVIQTIIGVITPIIGFIVGVIQGIIAFVAPIINTIVQLIIGAIAIVTVTIGAIVGFVGGVVGAIFGVIGTIAGWIWDNVLAPVVGFYTNVIGGIIGAVVGFVSKVFGVLGAIAGWIWSHVIQPVAGFFGGLWNGICNGLSGAAKTISNVFGTIVGIVKAPINAIVDLINGIIDGINSLKIPDWVPGLGGMSANIPKIPRLARGGFVTGAGTATSDSIPALLSNGEYVINARAVDLIGRDTLDNLNSGNRQLAYAGGGNSTVNNFYQFDRRSNSRWQYEQIKRGRL